jgi:hypothetical protein
MELKTIREVVQPLETHTAFYGTGKLVTAFTLLSLSWARPTQSTPFSFYLSEIHLSCNVTLTLTQLDVHDRLTRTSPAVQFACYVLQAVTTSDRSRTRTLVGTSRINSLSGFIGLLWTVRHIERASVKSNTPSSLPSSNAVSRLQLQSPGHRNQPPTSNIESSA